MTHRLTTPVRICPDCDGFAFVAITLGGRNRVGLLNTITAHCNGCHGTGILAPSRAPQTAGSRA